jgi:UDP-N-acetylmuramoyl-L-alanyl-D-glutamate--2,6-diaminopimelate ligase
VGVFLNISEDHISPIEHPSMEDYFASKLRIFSQTRTALVNTGTDRLEDVLEAAKESDRVITFGCKEGSDVYGYDIRKVGTETHFRVKCDRFDEEFVLTIPGLFNVENALAAITIANVYGIPLPFIRSGLLRARSKGRMESYSSADGKITAIVDYAHNKLSFEKLFSSMKEEYPEHTILSVFGCPGKKALVRRKDLGTIAGQFSKKVYLCAEDPGEEPVEEISKDIAQYVACPVEMIEDRGEAIRAAIRDSEGLTLILITGKGDETRQKYGREYVPCPSDVELTKAALGEYDATHGMNK